MEMKLTALFCWGFTIYVYMYYVVETVTSSPCNISTLADDSTEYFASEYSNNCYIFVMKKKEAKDARRFCRDMGGHLTDVDVETNDHLEWYILTTAANFSDIRRDYWIGLFWSREFDLYYWDTGANIRVSLENPGIWDGSCVILDNNFHLDESSCGNDRSFICKISLNKEVSTPDIVNETHCPTVCRKIIERYHLDKSGRPTDPATINTTERTVNTTLPALNCTDGDVDGSQEDCATDNSAANEIDKCTDNPSAETSVRTDVLVIAALGGVLGISLLANVIMLVLYKLIVYRRSEHKLCQEKTSEHVSLVDILNAENTKQSARNKSLGQSEPSPLGSTSELLYANDNTDGRNGVQDSGTENQFYASPCDIASKPKNDLNQTGLSSINNQETSRAESAEYTSPNKGAKSDSKKNDEFQMRPAPSAQRTTPISGAETALSSATPKDVYSKLDRDGLPSENIQTQNVYGPGSASTELHENDELVYQNQPTVGENAEYESYF